MSDRALKETSRMWCLEHDEELRMLHPNVKLALARQLIEEVADGPINYSDFEAAKAVRRAVERSRGHLRGLNIG